MCLYYLHPSSGRRLMRVGDWVRCEREAPAKGSSSRYTQRVGRLGSINRVSPRGHTPRYEYGVLFTTDQTGFTWFLRSELVIVEKPSSARVIRIPALQLAERMRERQFEDALADDR